MGRKKNLPTPGGGRQIQRLNIPNIFRKRSASFSEFVTNEFPNKTASKRGWKSSEKVSRPKNKEKYQTIGEEILNRPL